MMRIILKILLFPVTLSLTIILLICEFICMFGTMLLSILSLLLFTLALATMILLREMQDGLRAMVLAYLVSPYGIPMLAALIIGSVGQINERLKSI